MPKTRPDGIVEVGCKTKKQVSKLSKIDHTLVQKNQANQVKKRGDTHRVILSGPRGCEGI